MAQAIAIDTKRLARIKTLEANSHDKFSDGVCVMEAVSYIAREPFTDHPECVCPVLGAFMRSWNDGLPGDERNALLLPLIPRLVNTRGSKALEERRSLMAADWLIRTHTPAWLRLAGLTAQADALASLPEIVAMAQVPSIRGAIEAASPPPPGTPPGPPPGTPPGPPPGPPPKRSSPPPRKLSSNRLSRSLSG